MNAQVLQELERVRARIEELETQLRQSGTSATTLKVDPITQSGPSQGLTDSSAATPASESGAGLSAEAAPATKPAKAEPFAFADWTWLNGNPRTKTLAFDSNSSHPKSEPTLTTSTISTIPRRHNRRIKQFGLYSQTTPRNDASPARGQWNLDNAYRYLSEAYGGYHFNALHGINVDAGIFMSYIGLFSYYNFDNWAYQPSYVSSNTPSGTFIGTVSCSRCQELQPYKGYTRWTWALHSVSQGDYIVLVVRDNTYYLQGDKNQLLKYMEDKVEVTGSLEGRILTVQTIARPVKKTGKNHRQSF